MSTQTDQPKVDKTGQRIQKMFGEIAPRYDLLNHVLSMNIDRRWRKFTVDKLRLIPGVPVLDACTGTGDLALEIATRHRGQFKVIGSDFCLPMLQLARKKGKDAGFSTDQLEFIEADTLQLPFDSDTFQATTVAFGLRNVSDTLGGLRELARVTKRGGEVAILEFSKPTAPGLKQAYEFYFLNILPKIGQSIAFNRESAYSYLPESVMEFPSGEGLVELMKEALIVDVVVYPLTFGISSLYLGRVALSSL
jgi:demethylmenaquinone methyltransferase/2-methoxy-6-polyprenyl-1,4-benzoquinol methylase